MKIGYLRMTGVRGVSGLTGAWVTALSMLPGLLGGVAGLAVPAAESQGQVRIAMASGRGGGSMTPIAKRSFEDYAKLLSLTDDQKQSAQELFDGYRSEFKTAREEYEGKLQTANENMRDNGDFQASIKEMQELGGAFGEKSQKLESAFMGDLKALLTEKQGEQWSAVERHRRRDTGLRQSFFSGAGVDLITLVARTKSDPGTAEFKELLGQYELEIDRRLQESQRKAEDATKDSDKQSALDFEAQQETMKKLGEASKDLRDTNRDYVRRLAALMTVENRAAFEAEFSKRSFPTVFGETHVEQCLKAASEFADLDSTQKEQVESIREQFRKDAVPLNAAWSKAVDEAEEDAGGSMLMQMNAWSNGGAKEELKKARADRKELETKARKRLEEVLSPAQKGRLPAKKSGEEGGFQIRIGGPGMGVGEEDEE